MELLNRWQTIIPVLQEFQSCLSEDIPSFKIIAATDRNGQL